MSFGAIRPKWQASNEIGVNFFLIFLWTPVAHWKALSESYKIARNFVLKMQKIT